MVAAAPARRYITVGDRRYPLKTAAERAAARAGKTAESVARKVPLPGARAAVAFARRAPGRATPGGFTRYARSSRSKVPAALLLFALIVGIRMLRRGFAASGRLSLQAPTAQETVGLLVASLVIALLASVVPEVVTAFLLALAFVVAIDETDIIVGALNWLTSTIGGASGGQALPPLPGYAPLPRLPGLAPAGATVPR